MLGGGSSGAWQRPGRVSVVPGGHAPSAAGGTLLPLPRGCASTPTPRAITVTRPSQALLVPRVMPWQPTCIGGRPTTCRGSAFACSFGGQVADTAPTLRLVCTAL